MDDEQIHAISLYYEDLTVTEFFKARECPECNPDAVSQQATVGSTESYRRGYDGWFKSLNLQN
jgi:hypothetical protein